VERSDETANDGAGHRLVPHTADCIIEAWGPGMATCISEALKALVEEFADVTDTPAVKVLPLAEATGSAEDVLVQLLEEVIYTLDVFGVVPSQFHLSDTEDGGVAGDMEVVPVTGAEMIGPLPKGVSYHGLSMRHEDGAWHCRVLIDI
jgi:SHS2 domain-containing protein